MKLPQFSLKGPASLNAHGQQPGPSHLASLAGCLPQPPDASFSSGAPTQPHSTAMGTVRNQESVVLLHTALPMTLTLSVLVSKLPAPAGLRPPYLAHLILLRSHLRGRLSSTLGTCCVLPHLETSSQVTPAYVSSHLTAHLANSSPSSRPQEMPFPSRLALGPLLSPPTSS